MTQRVPLELRSARATMGTFLRAFYGEDDLAQAITCLNLTDLSLTAREMTAEDLVIQLKDILDRTELIDLETLSDDPEGDPYTFFKDAVGQVVIAPTDAGEWLFTPATVRTIPALWRSTEGQEIVAGVERVAPRSLALRIRQQVPASLRRSVLFLELWQWAGLGCLLLVAFLTGALAASLLRGILARVGRRAFRELDGKLLRRVTRPLGALLAALLVGAGFRMLALPVWALSMLDFLITSTIIGTALWSLYRVMDLSAAALGRRAEHTQNRYDDVLIPLLRRVGKILLTALAIIFLAENMGWPLAGLLAGVSLGGLALALAAQDTVKNLFGSVTVLADRPFQIGDWISVSGIEGTVEEVGLRSTRIRTPYDSLVTLANGELIGAAVDNYGARTYRRWKTALSLTYDTPPERIEAFCEGIRELIRQHPNTRKDSFHAYLNEFAAASLDVLLVVYFQVPDYATEMRERHRLSMDILRLAESLGVEFAFPTQTLYFHRSGGGAEESVQKIEEGFGEELRRARGLARDEARQLYDAGRSGRSLEPVSDAEPEPDARPSSERSSSPKAPRL